MAPEVINNEKYTEKADCFSFGIILWEIASREPPYKSFCQYYKLLLDKHGTSVSVEVAKNKLRPTVPIKTPECFAKLITRCWD